MTDESSTPLADATHRSPGCLKLTGYIVLALLLIPILYYGLYLLFKGPQQAGPQVIAHRGDSAHAPENTLSAFQAAAQSGAGWLEMDLQRTRDGRLVVIHDTGFGGVAGQRETETVEQRTFAEVHYVARDARRLRARDETGDFGGKGEFFGHDDC